MSGKLKSHASPAMLVALLALIVALGGSAIAATGALTAKQKKETGKIAGKVFTKRIAGATVARAKAAETAMEADSATKASEATKAVTAASANTATHADDATRAKTATSADLASKATDAEKLGGAAAGEYQRKLRAECPAPESISTIDQAGNVTCNTTAVKALQRHFATNEQFAWSLGNGLQLLITCHDGGNTNLHFQNLSSSVTGHISWFYGGSATAANSMALGPEVELEISYLAAQLQGSFIWTNGEGVDTLELHAVDSTSSCEATGTAVAALT